MSGLRRGVVALLAGLTAILLQTTLLGRVRLAGVAPDVVILAVVYASLRLRAEQALLLGFVLGLVFDALSSTALGLRALSHTTVAFLAVRTRDRADYSPFAVAVWAAGLTLVGMILFMGVGTLFSQLAIDGNEAVRRLLMVPLLNLLIGIVMSPLTSRLLEPGRRPLS